MTAAVPDRWRVLTLNLHCWQESDAEEKLHRVAATIAELRPDVVLLQEVGQHVEAPIVGTRQNETIRADNAALVIADALRWDHARPHNWVWFFAHIGFDEWEEGVALLTPHRIGASEGWYVSASRHQWNSRRLLVADVHARVDRCITMAGAHFSWWTDEDEPFAAQFDRADEIVRRRYEDRVFGGDFNVRADGPGYEYMMRSGFWTDAHAAAVAPAAPGGTFPGDIAGWDGEQPGRIDYVLVHGPHLRPRAARTVFDAPGDRVSDHYGVLVDFDLDWDVVDTSRQK